MWFKNNKNKIFFREFLLRLKHFFCQQVELWIFIGFIVLSGYCTYLWYSFIEKPHWSESRKKAYIKENDNEVSFDLSKFRVIIEKKHLREDTYQKETGVIPDIFHLK